MQTAPSTETNNALAMDPGCPLTMSSKEIADLLDVRHDSVKRAVERLADKEVIKLPPMVEASITRSNGRSQPTQVYNLEKRDSYVVVAQLSPEFTAGRCAHPEPKAAPIFTRSNFSPECTKSRRHIVSM